MKETDIYETFGHGGDYTGEYIDFSANISPLGVPQSVKQALHDLVDGGELAKYPDPYCLKLREAIAVREGVAMDQVVCGNGAADLIVRVAQVLSPKRAAIIIPTFTEYEAALRSVNCEVLKLEAPPVLNEYGMLCASSFGFTEELLEKIPKDLDMLFLCSPNNPTGRSVDHELMTKILDTCRAQGTRVFWDACFLDFVDLEDGADRAEKEEAYLRTCIAEYENLMVLRSMTKTYAIPGLRLGYLLSSDVSLIETLSKAGAPWSVSTAAQVAGIAALQDENYLKLTRRYVSEEKLQLWLGLLRMGRCFCRRGDGNFLLLWTEHADLAERLKKRGILVRNCSNFDGLDEHYIRIAIKTRRENQALYEALWEELRGGEQDG